jgi:predicted nucleic acid-binding protein
VIAVDTSVWIDFFAGRASPQVEHLRECLDGRDDVALTDIVLTEILQGLRSDGDVRRVDDYLSALEILRLNDLSDFRFAAALYRSARRRGLTIRRTNDCLIAAVCIRAQVPLLHADADFDRLASVAELAVLDLG